MQNALAPKSPEDVNNETAGDIQGGHFCSEKWKIFDSYVLLIAEKSTRLHTNRTPGLTPRRSPGRIQRKVLLLLINKIKMPKI